MPKAGLKTALVPQIVPYFAFAALNAGNTKALKPLRFKAFAMVRPMRFERTTYRVGVFTKAFSIVL